MGVRLHLLVLLQTTEGGGSVGNGLSLKVLGDGELLRYVEFQDYGWKRVEIGAEELMSRCTCG